MDPLSKTLNHARTSNLLSFKTEITPAASEGGTCEEGLCDNEEEDAVGVTGLDELGELSTDGGYHDCDWDEPSCDCCSCDPLRIINVRAKIHICN
ncbi:hypothetical protein CR513_60246, partial [Mucuna pruriens]